MDESRYPIKNMWNVGPRTKYGLKPYFASGGLSLHTSTARSDVQAKSWE